MNKSELIEFEKMIWEDYSAGKISAPIHLSGGNEEELINIFENIKKDDWVFASYRNHYHALLKNMPHEELKKRIVDGQSMHIMSKEHKLYTTSIVGAQMPIALGTALALKLKKSEERVY